MMYRCEFEDIYMGEGRDLRSSQRLPRRVERKKKHYWSHEPLKTNVERCDRQNPES